MKILAAIAFAAALTAASSAHAIQVFAVNSGTTDLGFYDAGVYSITGAGVVSLLGGGLGNGFDMRPDGTPNSIVAAPYAHFNPSGSTVATFGGTDYGAGGPGIKIGALMGSFVPVAPLGNNPAPRSNYFMIGYGTNVTLTAAGHLYAQVNDTFYSNDGGFFDVTVTRVVDPGPGIPEPRVWSLMIVGFLASGAMLRRRFAVSSGSRR